MTLLKMRFAPCVESVGLLMSPHAAARLAHPGGTIAFSPAGAKSSDDFKLAPMNRNHLTNRQICRGKISRRNNQNHLKERTPSAPNL